MKLTSLWMILLLFQISCSKQPQREESYDDDDLRSKDNFKRSVPVDDKKIDFENGFQSHD